ncbi:MAG: YibE/F family protein [Clostridia bacterium]|nr:YibE/F family protein [Clostridia bacterium]
MKKVTIVLCMFLLMITSLTVFVSATEPDTQENTELIEKNDYVVDTVARVMETYGVKEVVTGTVTDKVQEVKIEIVEGDYIGEEFTTNYVLTYDIAGKIQAYELDVGDRVLVQLTEDDEGNVIATVQDVAREKYIILMFVVFLLSIVLVCGKQGVKAIVGLIATIIIIYCVFIQGVFEGKDAIIYSILATILTIGVTFVIIGGFNKKVLTATLGTLGGVLSAGVMALIFNNLAKMTGASEEAIQLTINIASINFEFRDLLFSGIVISALGACMDVGMSIASSLDEIKMKNPEITWKELLKSGMNIGRDTIGTMTNTLILAYVGSSVSLILLFMASDLSVIEILNKETIAEQIISALAGSMGVVYTVPITSFVYAVLNKDQVIYKKVSDNKLNGKRSLKI